MNTLKKGTPNPRIYHTTTPPFYPEKLLMPVLLIPPKGSIIPFLVLLLLIREASSVEPIAFPKSAGVVNVRDFGAIPNDGRDDTAAIQAALEKYPNGNRIIHLPPGVFLITDTLKWGGSNSGNAQKRTILQGSGQSLTILKLPDSTPGFDDPEKTKALVWTGKRPAQRFRNAVRDLTIEVGAKNPGAIALQFNASYQGCIRQVTLRAADGSGKIGLDLGHTDEIGPLLVKHLTVEGFEVGISTKWPVNSNTFEHLSLRSQRRYGWWNYHQMVFARGMLSRNSVPALFNQKDSWGTVTLLDSKIEGLKPGKRTPGILNQRQMALKDVTVTGYPKSIDHADKGRDKGDIESPGLIGFDTSHANVAGLFRDLPGDVIPETPKMTFLEVKETPQVPWGNPDKDWVNIVDFGADPAGKRDSTAALQAAIDSGARTVFLPGGANFKLTGKVEIRGPVERITGLEGRFFTEGNGSWSLVDNAHPKNLPDAPVVIIERLSSRSGGPGVKVHHRSKRTLVVSSTIGVSVEGEGTGDIFIEDIAGRLNLNQPGQSAWCRQLNTEHQGTMLRNNGGRLWVLGMKTEKIGTIIETVNGGITEAYGIFVYSNRGWQDGIPAFVIEDSTAILAGINERNFNRRPVSLWFRETRDGVTREQKERAWVYLSR